MNADWIPRAVEIFEQRMGFAYTDEYSQSREWSDSAHEAMVEVESDGQDRLIFEPELQWGDTQIIVIEHKNGNTLQGPLHLVLSTHLAAGWKLRGVLALRDTKEPTA